MKLPRFLKTPRFASIVLLIGVLIAGALILRRGPRETGVVPPDRDPRPGSRPATIGSGDSPATKPIRPNPAEETRIELQSFAAARARMSELIASIPLDLERVTELRGLVDYWALADLEGVWQFLSEVEDVHVRGELLVRVVKVLVAEDLDLAFDKALMLAGDNRSSGSKALRNVGAHAELVEMDGMMEKAGSRTNRSALFGGFLHEQQDYAKAHELISGPYFEGLTRDDRVEAMSFTGRLLAKEDLATAVEVLRGISEAWDAQNMASGFASEWASAYRDDRKQGAARLRTQEGEEALAPVFGGYYRQWLREDPNTALRSATELPEVLRKQLIPGLVETWLGRDSMAVGREVRQWEPGPERDRAIEGIVEFLIRTDARGQAEEWVEAIADETMRTRLLEDFGDP